MDTLYSVLQQDFLGKPIMLWLIFAAIVVALLVLDLGVFHKKEQEPTFKDSLGWTVFYIIIALIFGGWIWHSMGETRGLEYFTGYAMEKSLSLDNIFVISMIFSALSIPAAYQHRVLFWGILGVVVLRGIMIALGAALVAKFSWILLVFGAFLLVTGVKMLVFHAKEKNLNDNPLLKWMRKHMLVTDKLHGQRFFVRQENPKTGKKALWVTPLFIALALVEFADLIFAVDSVPAIFAVTQDPYIVYTSNIFAILGLRALYFCLQTMTDRFAYLSKALALVLVFIGGKIIYTEITHDKLAPEVSLGVVMALILGGVIVSLLATRPSAGK